MIKTGLSAVRESLEKAKAKASSQSSQRGLNYFSWKDGEKKIVRFLTDDDILTGRFYEFVQGNDGRPHDFLYAPDILGEGTEDFVLKYGGKSFERGMSGPLVEPKLKERIIGLGVLREEVPNPSGSGLIVRDHIYDIDVNGTTYQARWFGLVKQATGNFWTHLLHAASRYGDTICNRDYEITREGSNLETKYHIIPLDPDPDLKDVETVQKYYGYGKPWDDSDPDRYLYCPQTIRQWAEGYAGEDRVKYWLAPKEGQSLSGLNEFHPATTSNPDEAQAAVPSGTEFDSLRERLLKNR